LCFVTTRGHSFCSSGNSAFTCESDEDCKGVFGGEFGNFAGGLSVDSQVPPDQLRKQVIAEVRKKTAEHLASKGAIVAADRIAVTLV
jgi:hypothetical protein